MPAGRPSKYEPEFCESLVQHFANGKSLSSFAHLCGVHIDTLYAWRDAHPEFSEALKKAADARKGKLEDTALLRAIEGSDTLMIFALKNMAGWRDKVDHEVSGGVTVELVKFSEDPPAE